MEDFVIKKATIEDVPALVKLVNSAYRGETSKIGWTSEAELLDGIRIDEEDLSKLLQEKDAVILKYTTADNTFLGCVYLKQQDKKMYLGMLTVSPMEQAKGIGKQLMIAAEDYTKEAGCILIEMTVITVRSELIRWYERRGFSTTSETKPFPDDPRFGVPKQPLEFVVMQKFL